jgi:hypothetical protein
MSSTSTQVPGSPYVPCVWLGLHGATSPPSLPRRPLCPSGVPRRQCSIKALESERKRKVNKCFRRSTGRRCIAHGVATDRTRHARDPVFILPRERRSENWQKLCSSCAAGCHGCVHSECKGVVLVPSGRVDVIPKVSASVENSPTLGISWS